MSLMPRGGHKVAPSPWFVDHRPEIYMNMGLTAEERAAEIQRFARGCGRVLATAATRTRCKAQAEGKFDEEIVPVEDRVGHSLNGKKPKVTKTVFAKDEGPRADTTAGSARQAEAGVSRQRHGDGGQFVPNQRRRGGGAS